MNWKRDKAECPFCEKTITLTQGGWFFSHSSESGRSCPGSYNSPEEITNKMNRGTFYCVDDGWYYKVTVKGGSK
jgi:hypothetical protein